MAFNQYLRNIYSQFSPLVSTAIPILFSSLTFPIVSNILLILLSNMDPRIIASYALASGIQMIITKGYETLTVKIRIDAANLADSNHFDKSILLINSIVTAIMSGLIIYVIFSIIPHLINILDMDKNSPEDFLVSMKIIGVGMPFIFLYLNLASFCQGIQQAYLSVIATWISIIPLVLLAILKYMNLISINEIDVPLLGFLVSRVIMALSLLFMVLKSISIQPAFCIRKYVFFIKSIFKFGLSNCISSLSMTINSYVVTLFAASLSAVAVTSLQIQLNLLNLAILFISSISTSAGIQISRKPVESKLIMKNSSILLWVLTTLIIFLVYEFYEYILPFYTSNLDVQSVLISCKDLFLTLICLEVGATFLQTVLLHMLDRKSPVIRMLNAWIITIPCIFIFTSVCQPNLYFILCAYILSACLTVSCYLVRFRAKSRLASEFPGYQMNT